MSNKMKINVFLPCKKNSTRVENKNKRKFANVHYGLLKVKIDQLLKCKFINKIYLSTDDKKIIWSFINQYDSNLSPSTNPEFDKLIDYAIHYYIDFVLPNKKYLDINDTNKIIFEEILNVLKKQVSNNNSAEEIQTLLYEVGKKNQFENLKDYFKLVYQVILGQEQGPRLGSFIKLYGIQETINIIEKKIEVYKD